MIGRGRRLLFAGTVLGLTLALCGIGAETARAECREAARFAGEDTGLGGTGSRGEDTGLGGTGLTGDHTGLGGTGVFGVITSFGSICINGAQVHLAQDLRVFDPTGMPISSEALAVGQTIWLVAVPGADGFTTDEIWLLPDDLDRDATAGWLADRIRDAGPLTRLSVEGPVETTSGVDRFRVHGLAIEAKGATDLENLRSAAEAARDVRVSGAPIGDSRGIAVDRVALPPPRPEPPPRDSRPMIDRVRPPERPDPPERPEPPPALDRPIARPDTDLRQILDHR